VLGSFIEYLAEALAMLETALGLARHVSEIRDVLTSKTIALLQLDIEEKGLFNPPHIWAAQSEP
jgi:hypothetical protein